MNEATSRAHLDACLLTDADLAFGLNAWHRFKDPFPAWLQDEELAHLATIDVNCHKKQAPPLAELHRSFPVQRTQQRRSL
jgi:hypothetical protein